MKFLWHDIAWSGSVGGFLLSILGKKNPQRSKSSVGDKFFIARSLLGSLSCRLRRLKTLYRL